ncbi:MAG: sulfite exporter TauE/SafE family protein [Microthrixaceae bacterium]
MSPDATTTTKDPRRTIEAALVGVLAGFLAGLFGVGGGILMVPALVMVMRMDQRLAHGTSLAAVVPIAVSSTISYAISGEVDWAVVGWLALGAIAGAVVGTHLLASLSPKLLGGAFAALLVATALRLLLDQGAAGGRASLGVVGALVLVLTGLASGVIAGLLGVGGGIVMVPVMVVGFDMSAALAKGSSLAVIVPTAVMGTWRNLRKDNVDVRVAVVSGLAGVISGFLAGLLSVDMSEALSNTLFAVLLAVVALRMLWQLWRTPATAGEIEDTDPVG